MYQSIEAVMLTEFCMDLLALWAALRPKRRVSPGKLVLSAALGAMASALATLLSMSAVAKAVISIAFMPFMIRISAGPLGIIGMLGAASAMLAVSALFSAAMHLIGAVSPAIRIASASAAALAAVFVTGRQRRWLDSWEVRIRMTHNDCETAFTALIDTGNRLAEPLSGLPVIVAEESQLRGILPKAFNAADAAHDLPDGFRLLAYGGVGGNGVLGCFMPDLISADGILLDGHWVAVYPGRLPGRYSALAPPSTISSINTSSKRRTIKCPAQDP